MEQWEEKNNKKRRKVRTNVSTQGNAERDNQRAESKEHLSAALRPRPTSAQNPSLNYDK
jgi:hypothetical protein